MFVASFLLLAAQPIALAAQEAPQIEAQPGSDAPIDWEKEFGVEKKVRDPVTGEFPVDPYAQSPANLGAKPFDSAALARAFGGQPGIRKITERTVALSTADPRIKAIFAGHDLVRLNRVLFEQVCAILNAGCQYSGRDMKTAHKALGTTRADLNALVEHLQRAMREGGVPFAAQNRLLAKLAPMDRNIVER